MLTGADPRVVGVLFVVSAILLNERSVTILLLSSVPHFIISELAESARVDLEVAWATYTRVVQICLVLAALCCWLLSRRWRISPTVGVALLLVGWLSVGAGAAGMALEHGWVRVSIRQLSELCRWLSNGSAFPSGSGQIQYFRDKLEKIRSVPGRERETVEFQRRLADHLLRHNRVKESIEHLESALRVALSDSLSRNLVNPVRRELGVSYLRAGEFSRCLLTRDADGCLPLRGSGLWADRAMAVEAIRYFDDVLRENPDDIRARWLLNVAHMAAGSYPSGVAEELRVPTDVIASQADAAAFVDVAVDVGVGAMNRLGGAIMDDFDGDGLQDVITSTFDACAANPILYYHNKGDGTFAEWSERAKLGEQYGGFNLVQADYDNDGRLDILVLRGAWGRQIYGRQLNSLLRQEEDGHFVDVTEAAGLGTYAYPTQAAAWADFDNDGDLDLYIGNEFFPSQLFRNNGDGTFTDIASTAGVRNMGYAKGVNWGDYDGDGDPDLYVSNWGQANRLYRNNGDGTFTDVAGQLGVALGDTPNHRTFVPWFWDVNNDGWLDLFVGGFGAEHVGIVAADYLGAPASAARLRLFLNDGAGGFRDVTRAMGLYQIQMPMGANYGDVDNDGFPDFYLGTGAPPFDFLLPNVMYRNVQGERFEDITAVAGVGRFHKGHGIAFGDLDNDGDQDVFAQFGGWYPADESHDALFLNPGNANNWIAVTLVGEQSNRSAIGARIKLTVDTDQGLRSIYSTVSSGGSFGASTLQQEIGVGVAREIRELEVYWPTTGATQRFTDLAVNQFISIWEGAESYTVLTRPRIEFRPPR